MKATSPGYLLIRHPAQPLLLTLPNSFFQSGWPKRVLTFDLMPVTMSIPSFLCLNSWPS